MRRKRASRVSTYHCLVIENPIVAPLMKTNLNAGSIPRELWQLVNLTHLDLSHNALFDVNRSRRIAGTGISGTCAVNRSCRIISRGVLCTYEPFGTFGAGELPKELGNLVCLANLDISYNAIGGECITK